MITHYILLSSSYTNGERIALHYATKDYNKDMERFQKIFPYIKEKCGRDVSVSSHMIKTEKDTFKSVVDKDPFFENVHVIDDIDDFVNLILQDRKLTGLDVAKYIACKCKCTHLKLEKLTYLCYCDYLCKYNKKLFEDYIFAYTYGPIVSSVFNKCSKYKNREIKMREELEMPFRSRITFAEDGINKIFSIDETLKKYSYLSASGLVTLTHKECTPWDVTKNKTEITDEVILKFHKNEVIK